MLKISASSAYPTHQERVGRSESRCYWTCCWWCGASVYVLGFALETDILSVWCKDYMTYNMFDDFWQKVTASRGSSLFNDSLNCTRNYCGYGSITSNFPQGSASSYFRWSGHLCIVSLSVYPGTSQQCFTEIGLYLTDTDQNKGWHFYIETHDDQRLLVMSAGGWHNGLNTSQPECQQSRTPSMLRKTCRFFTVRPTHHAYPWTVGWCNTKTAVYIRKSNRRKSRA